jgi:hypothetical protein
MVAACCSSISSISTKVSISWTSSIRGRVWVDGSVVASSPDHKRRWLTLLGGIVRVVFRA